MHTFTLQVTGMTCDHCTQDALNALHSVRAPASFAAGQTQVETRGLTGNARLLEAIESKGSTAPACWTMKERR